jgi:hypothetical protein
MRMRVIVLERKGKNENATREDWKRGKRRAL